MHPLAIAWFILVAVLIAAYAALDGFDLGAGFWSLFAKDEADRGAHLAAVGPFWDGNEVWLLTGGGAIFAAFPEAYATIFSGFYFAFIVVILAFIFRAVAIEFRLHHDAPAWRRFWGIAFGIGSAVPPVIFGVAVGNLLRGIPLDAGKDYAGGFASLLNPYALFAGVVVLVLFAAHGAAWMALKTDGDLAVRSRRRASLGALVGAVLLAAFFSATAVLFPERTAKFSLHPDLFLIPAAAVVAALLAAVLARRGRMLGALLAQGAAIASGVAFVAAAMFPFVVPASNDVLRSLTIANAASTPLTQTAMLVIAGIGLPFVVLYHVWVYRAFAGKGRGNA